MRLIIRALFFLTLFFGGRLNLLIDQLNENDLLRLSIFKHYFFLSWEVIIELLSILMKHHLITLSCLNEWLGLDHARNLTISALSSYDGDLNFVLVSSGLDLSLFKTKVTREVLIQYGNNSLGIITWKSSLLRMSWVIKLNLEIQVRLPVVVVDDWDFDTDFFLSFLNCNNFINTLVAYILLGCSLNSSDTKSGLLSEVFLDDSNSDMTCRLNHGVLKAFEANIWVLVMNFAHIFSSSLSLLSLDLKELFGSSKSCSFSSGKSLE